jgi:hypothetical protein
MATIVTAMVSTNWTAPTTDDIGTADLAFAGIVQGPSTLSQAGRPFHDAASIRTGSR